MTTLSCMPAAVLKFDEKVSNFMREGRREFMQFPEGLSGFQARARDENPFPLTEFGVIRLRRVSHARLCVRVGSLQPDYKELWGTWNTLGG